MTFKKGYYIEKCRKEYYKEMAYKLKEYREPKKVQDIVVDAWISGKCPRCLKTVFDEDKFCKHCGQALNWDIPKEE